MEKTCHFVMAINHINRWKTVFWGQISQRGKSVWTLWSIPSAPHFLLPIQWAPEAAVGDKWSIDGGEWWLSLLP